MSDRLVSIIIPYYNEPELLRDCLDSIYSSTGYSAFEVIVVDDASPGGGCDMLWKEFPDTQFIRKEKNGGFVASCNSGAGAASGEFLLFLNHDTRVTRGWLSAMVDTFDDVPEAGVVGSKLVFPDSGLIQHAGGIYRKGDGLWALQYKRAPASHPLVNRRCEVQWVTGACFMIEKGLFFEVGQFDPGDIIEDQDICFKVRRLGKKVIYCPESMVYHIQDSTGIISFNLRYWYQQFLARWGDEIVFDDEDIYSRDRFDPEFVNRVAGLGEGSNFNYVLMAIDILGLDDAESQRDFIEGKSEGYLISNLLDRTRERAQAYSNHFVEMSQRLRFKLGMVRFKAGDFTEADMLFSSLTTGHGGQSYPHERMIMLALCDIGREHFRRGAYRLGVAEFPVEHEHMQAVALILRHGLHAGLGRDEEAEETRRRIEEFVDGGSNKFRYKVCRKLVEIAEALLSAGMGGEVRALVGFMIDILARCEEGLLTISTAFSGGHRYTVTTLLANAGSICERLGEFNDALELYERAYALMGDGCRDLALSIHYHLGTLNLELGHMDEAELHLAQTLELEPGHGKALKYLERLLLESELEEIAVAPSGGM
jgi:GT2 family glycosyltransferase/tetratricopeptide (TPR) repeat protein